MSNKEPKYIEGVGWRYETEHSMLRRRTGHDYQSRSIYMLTMCVKDRRPLLGTLKYAGESEDSAYIEPTALGSEVERCWLAIPEHYPEVRPLAFQLMPDHVHGLLFIERSMEAHLGQIVKGFKIGCSKAKWRIEEATNAQGQGATQEQGQGATLEQGQGATLEHGQDASLATPTVPCSSNYNSTQRTPATTQQQPATVLQQPARLACRPVTERVALFESGYQDTVLRGRNQLDTMFCYIQDNPRRLGIKQRHPDLFRVVSELEVCGIRCAAIGNRWLLDRGVRMQVRCHNNTTPDNLRLIARQKAYFLERGRKGGIVVSPCISAGEKEIARAVLDAGHPLIVILENGFPPFYKPPGKYFEACTRGLLLMLAPWPYHMEKRTITRSQCLTLNDMAHSISDEPWTPELEATLKH